MRCAYHTVAVSTGLSSARTSHTCPLAARWRSPRRGAVLRQWCRASWRWLPVAL